MNVNNTEQPYSDDDFRLAEPRFDEEATVLSARPVVPLHEIKEAKSRRHLAFGLSMLASLIVGGLVATLIFKQRSQKAATEIAGSAIAGSGANSTDAAVASSSDGEVKQDVPPVSESHEDANAGVQATLPVERPDTRTVRRLPANGVEPTSKLVISRAERGEMRRAERLEERRLRRQAARDAGEAGGRRRRSSDDLLRIREIFEGSPRP